MLNQYHSYIPRTMDRERPETRDLLCLVSVPTPTAWLLSHRLAVITVLLWFWFWFCFRHFCLFMYSRCLGLGFGFCF